MGQIITALEPQKRQRDRVSVFLDGEFAFGLPDTEAARLRVGQELSEDAVAALRGIDEVTRALDRAVRLLARRPYSAAEIRRSLSSKEVAPGVIDEVLARLTALGYVDDAAFAQYWVENRERFRPRGARALRYELRQKGIADAIISRALDGYDGAESAYAAAQDQARRLRGLDRRSFRNRLGAFLARRGFDYDTAREAVDRLVRDLDETDAAFFAGNDAPDDAPDGAINDAANDTAYEPPDATDLD
ncbi:MAG TPA: RecX family transcriptional regulator [Aggregatilineaceae bacterium]|jgi:regulatory protein|nr:RecX family transcriptional regulator [Aggregatilineaceae bacterium]